MTADDSAIPLRPIAVGGTAQAAAAVLLFSFNFPATDWALEGFGPWSITGLRGMCAALIAAVCLAVRRVPLPRRADRRGLLVVALGCIVGYPLLTSVALQISSTAHSAVVIGLLPLATAVLSVLRSGARPPRAFWLAGVAGAVAVIAFTLQQSGGRPGPADAYLLLALLVCAAGYSEGGRLARHLPGWQITAWGIVAALPFTAAISVVGLRTEPVHPHGQALAGLAYLALIQFGGFVVWYRGMAAIGVPRASQLQLAQPLLTLVWAVAVLGERLPATAPLAAAAVVLCIAVTQRARE